jgi:hypothetical protein
MDKEKIVKGLMWLSGFSLSILLSAVSLFAGFNNVDKADNYTLLVIGIALIPAIFFFAYKGFGLILKAIFDK